MSLNFPKSMNINDLACQLNTGIISVGYYTNNKLTESEVIDGKILNKYITIRDWFTRHVKPRLPKRHTSEFSN